MQELVGDALDRRWTLCLLLLLEKARGKDSFWAEYIDALPTSYSAHPSLLAFSNLPLPLNICWNAHDPFILAGCFCLHKCPDSSCR